MRGATHAGNPGRTVSPIVADGRGEREKREHGARRLGGDETTRRAKATLKGTVDSDSFGGAVGPSGVEMLAPVAEKALSISAVCVDTQQSAGEGP